jgi:hypothetical protein
MKKSFEPVMPVFANYLIYSLQRYNESSLMKAALCCISSIVNAIEDEFHKYSDSLIPILMEILTNSDVSRFNKTTAITTLGEISFHVREHFLKYFDNVMELLLSASELATTNPEDEEDEEYYLQLRYELIETFTYLSFTLDDCREKSKLVPYVPRIFTFFNTIIGDGYQQKPVM